jgi:hypothetical protein
MDRETLKLILRERKAGWEHIAKLDLLERRRATFSERLRDLDVMAAFARSQVIDASYETPDTSEGIRARWKLIREQYAHRLR